MRVFLTCFVAMATTLARGADTGVPPRPASTDYPVNGRADNAVIAAAVIPSQQVAKMFSPDIDKRYVVVEVAIYPENGVPFDVQSADFALRVGQRVGRADPAIDVAPWPERRATPSLPVDVTTETGVIYQRSSDPVYGHQQSVGTYTGVAVSAPGQNAPPPPDPKDPRIVYDKVRLAALADGPTQAAIAGYLYFPQYEKRRKSDEIELKYAKHAQTVNLVFPKRP